MHKHRDGLNASAHSFANANHLHQEVAEHLIEHLHPIRNTPQKILDLGCGTGEFLKRLRKYYPKAEIFAIDIAEERLARIPKSSLLQKNNYLCCADVMQLPFADESFDCVISNLLLHWLPNIPDFLKEIKRVLKTDGLFMFSYYGPDTLKQLGTPKESFFDMHDIGDALVRTQFNDPVLDSEIITVEYDSAEDALNDLSANGELALINTAMVEHGEIDITYEIVYGHAWKGAKPMTSKIDQDGMVRISPAQIQRKT